MVIVTNKTSFESSETRSITSSSIKHRPGIGSVSDLAASTLFVPGSVADAPTSGKEFFDMWKEHTGEELAWINSNMSIKEYPGQIIRSPFAIKRDNRVEDGIEAYIKATPSDDVEIIAHSAGSAQALRAALKYKENGGKKNIRLFLMGGGSPGVTLRKVIKKLDAFPKVEISNVVDKFDMIPRLVGTRRHRVFKRDLKPDLRATNKKETALQILRFMSSPIKAHRMKEYVESVATQVKMSRARKAFLEEVDKAFSAEIEDAPSVKLDQIPGASKAALSRKK